MLPRSPPRILQGAAGDSGHPWERDKTLNDLPAAHPPIDVFITEELYRRTPKQTDYLQEKLALQDLARQMIDSPAEVLPHLVDLAMELSGGTSGGVSLYEAHPVPGVFRWHFLRGKLMPFNGATTPRNDSPCGVCLDRSAPLLSRSPERAYTWLADANITVPEVLLVPLYVAGSLPLGTLWITSEDEGHFDSGHARVMTELAAFVGIALHMLRTEERLQQALEQQELLTKEMGHRVKNLFAITQGMISVTARTASTPQEMSQILSGRLRALTDAHSLVRRNFDDTGSANEGTDLDKLVRTILSPHKNGVTPAEQDQINIDGPSFWLGPRATNGFALILHELATNAAKYGALKNESGFARVYWRQENDRLNLTWEERGGPIIEAEPTSRGFGSMLAKSTVVGQLGGSLIYDWRAEGLSVIISIPVENLTN
jgi:two-component sensor histidine kinase